MNADVPADLAAGLSATRDRRGPFGTSIHYFAETGSTNDVAAALAQRGAPEGTVVIAGRQTAGRGRLGRVWHSPADAGLYVSVIFRTPSAAPFLTLAGGVAVAEGIRTATGLPVEIKWPNDVVVTGAGSRRKIAGILAEGSTDADGVQVVILGMGINVRPSSFPPEVADRASSLETELGRAVDAGQLLGEILASLAVHVPALSRGGAQSVLDRWRTLSPQSIGARVEWDGPSGRLAGITGGIAPDGALLVRVGDRVERIISGEVVWR